MKRLLWLVMLFALLYGGASEAYTCQLTPDPATITFGNLSGAFNDNVPQSFTVTCTQNAPRNKKGAPSISLTWTVNFDPGLSGNTNQEQMFGQTTGNLLNYNLYKDPAHTIPLGGDFDSNATESGTFIIPAIPPGSGTPSSVSSVFTVYGEVPAQSGLAADNYVDTMFANLIDSNNNFWNSPAINISATVPPQCGTGSANNVSFGMLNPSTASGDITVISNVTEFCTQGTPFAVVMNTGLHAATPGDPTTRRMADGTGDFLPYHLYVDSAHTNEIGTVPNSVTGAGNYLFGYGNGNTSLSMGPGIPLNFYAVVKLSDLQVAPAGNYSDTVTVTVYY